MTQVFNTESWYYIVMGIVLFPTLCWQVLGSVIAGLASHLTRALGDSLHRYGEFWKYVVRQDGRADQELIWYEAIFINKFTRLMNLVSFYWVWGYLLFLICAGISILLKWGIELISLIFSSIYKGIKFLYKAL